MPQKTRVPPGMLLAAICLILSAAAIALAGARTARAQQPEPPSLQGYFRPGEAKARFEAWEKRVRKFESALTGTYAPQALSAVADRLRLVASDMERERLELARRYETALDKGRRTMTEAKAVIQAETELGYGADAVRYADNVTAYAKSLADRIEARAASLLRAVPATPTARPAGRWTPPPGP